MGRIKSLTVLICMLSVAVAWGAAFKDDFNRADGDVGNGWATQADGTIEVSIVDDEVLIAGEQGTDWVRSGISRDVVDETRVSFDFKADDAFNVHIRINDAETSAYFEPYWPPGSACQYANSVDGGWPGWTAIAGSNMIAGEYNTVVVELEETTITLTLNGEVIGTFTNDNLTSIGNILIASDSAAGTNGSLHIDNVEIGTVVVGTAKEPSPAQGAGDVPRDVVLAWVPGEYAATHDVYFGTVFADVDSASRASPMGALVSQGQTADTYDHDELLEFATTYYWRIDEVNAAPDSTIFKGDVWSFTTEPFAYTVGNILATSTVGSSAGEGPENTVNGSGLNANGEHSINAPDMWLTSPGAGLPSIQFEFDRLYKLHQMFVWNYNVQFELVLGFGLKDVTIEYSVDGTEWIVLADTVFAQGTAQAGYQANTTINFEGAVARYVRFTATSGYGPLGQFGLSEVQFTYIPAHPREPQPADAAVDVSVDTALTWRSGRDAVSHEVFLGTDPDALALVDTIPTASYTPDPLDLGTTYYWQINEIQDAESWAGNVWSFSTQAYLIVDDFESYDDEENTIFDTWIDGFVNETGSTVGYFDAPFAERTIVHGGRQSMPLEYNNAGVTTSEAEYDVGQDWSTNGIQSLTLYFYGDVTNTAAQLYVKIDGTRIDYDGAAVNLTRPSWQTWSIDLAGAGNVSNVNLLTIGIEGAGATGLIFIDDIRLYPEVLDVSSADITGAGDTVQGVPNDDDWPAAETPDLAIDDDTATKFLHFKGATEPTGIQITPLAGATTVTGITFTTANDAVERDPASFELYGSNTSIDGPYTLIAGGDIVDFTQADPWPRFTKNETEIAFDNDVAYTHYQVLFLMVRDPGSANSMQIAEIELLGEVAP